MSALESFDTSPQYSEDSCVDTEKVVLNHENDIIPNGIGTFNDSIHEENLDPSDNEDERLSKPYNRLKIERIQEALIISDTDYLCHAAIDNDGLVTDFIRRKVWPKILGLDMYETSMRPMKDEVEGHPYYQQVLLDVNRSLKRFPPSIREKQRLMMQDQLVLLIMRVLIKNPKLHYYQGYHDICVTVLLVLGEEMAFHVVDQLSETHLSEFMKKSMEPTSVMLHYMYPIILKENPNLHGFLEKSNVGIMFALSWLITWFSHVLNNYQDVVRLFDFFIASSEWMPVYLSTAIVLHRQSDIMEVECEISAVHSFLLNLPDDLPFEKLIIESIRLYKAYPPASLEKSVLMRLEAEEKARLQLRRPKKESSLFGTVCKTLWYILPARKLPVVIAAVVVFYAVYYQTYKT